MTITEQTLKMHEEIRRLKNSHSNYKALLLERERLESLGKNVSEIDKILDTFPEEIEEEFLAKREQYLATHHPEWHLKYYALQKKREELKGTYALAFPFYHTLKQGVEQMRRKKTLLEIFFGRNRKALLACALFDAEKQASKIVEKTSGSLRAHLEHFLEESNKPWNHSLYNGKFMTLYSSIAEIMDDLHRHLDLLSEEIKEMEEERTPLF